MPFGQPQEIEEQQMIFPRMDASAASDHLREEAANLGRPQTQDRVN